MIALNSDYYNIEYIDESYSSDTVFDTVYGLTNPNEFEKDNILEPMILVLETEETIIDAVYRWRIFSALVQYISDWFSEDAAFGFFLSEDYMEDYSVTDFNEAAEAYVEEME